MSDHWRDQFEEQTREELQATEPRTPGAHTGVRADDETSSAEGEEYNPDVMTLIGDVVQQPLKAFAHLASDQTEKIGVALIVYVLSQLPRTWLQNPFGFQSTASRLIGNAVVSIVALVFVVAIVHFCARMLGGHSRYGNILQAEALAGLPNLLATPLLVVSLFTGSDLLWAVVNGVASIWAFVLSVIAVRQVYSFSTGRAVAAILLPAILLVALAFGLAIITGALLGGMLAL